MLRKHKIKFIFLLATLMSIWMIFPAFAKKCTSIGGSHCYLPSKISSTRCGLVCMFCGDVQSSMPHAYTYEYDKNNRHRRTCALCGDHGSNNGYEKCTILPTTITEPSYTSPGVKSNKCILCQHEETEEIPKLTCTHAWGAWQNKDSNHQRTCSTCKTTQTGDHQWGAWKDNA